MYYARVYVMKDQKAREHGYDDRGFLECDTLNPSHSGFTVPDNAIKIDFYDEAQNRVIKRAFLTGEVWSERSIAWLGNYEAYMAANGATNCVFVDALKRPFLANENDLVYNRKTESFDRVSEIAANLALAEAREDDAEEEITRTRSIREDEGEALPEILPPDIRDRIITPQIVPVVPERGPEKPRYIPGITGPIPGL